MEFEKMTGNYEVEKKAIQIANDPDHMNIRIVIRKVLSDYYFA